MLFGCHGDNKKMLSSFACVDDFEFDELIWVILQNKLFVCCWCKTAGGF